MDKFIAWWHSSAEELNWDWMEHIALMLGAAALAWLVWKVVFRQLLAVSKKTRTHWDTIVLHSISTPISVFIWLWPTSFSIGSLLELTAKVGSDWMNASRRMLVMALVLWVVLRLVNAVEENLLQSDSRDQTTVSAIGHVMRLSLAVIGVLTFCRSLASA